jgi:hypothetical protein
MRAENASSIQKANSDDSIVVFQQHARDFFDSIDPKQTIEIRCGRWLRQGHFGCWTFRSAESIRALQFFLFREYTLLQSRSL